MNAVTEQDLDLLEEYLDGALSPEEMQRVSNRLAEEPGLAAVMGELREQREVRSVVWQELEPTQAYADAFANKTIAAARRQDRWTRVGRFSRLGSAAAACLLVGFFAGWLGREQDGARPVNVSPIVNAFVEPPRATLGVYISEIRYQAPGRAPMPRLLVWQVLPGSAAAGAGLREGDLLLSVDGQAVHDVPSLASALSSRSGPRVLRILRNNQVGDITIQPK